MPSSVLSFPIYLPLTISTNSKQQKHKTPSLQVIVKNDSYISLKQLKTLFLVLTIMHTV